MLFLYKRICFGIKIMKYWLCTMTWKFLENSMTCESIKILITWFHLYGISTAEKSIETNSSNCLGIEWMRLLLETEYAYKIMKMFFYKKRFVLFYMQISFAYAPLAWLVPKEVRRECWVSWKQLCMVENHHEGAGSLILVLCKSYKFFELLSHLSSPQKIY